MKQFLGILACILGFLACGGVYERLGFLESFFFSFLFLEFFATHDANLGLRIWIWADSTTLLCEEKWAFVVAPTQSVLLYN